MNKVSKKITKRNQELPEIFKKEIEDFNYKLQVLLEQYLKKTGRIVKIELEWYKTEKFQNYVECQAKITDAGNYDDFKNKNIKLVRGQL